MDELNEIKQYKQVCKPQFEAIFEHMARKEEQDKIGKKVDLIYTRLFEGNGTKPLITRVELLEQLSKTNKEDDKNAKEDSHAMRNWILGILAAIIFLVFQTMFLDWLATRNHLAQPTETKQAGK